ncbi:DUF3488 domain-containing protein [Ahniella affigens]|uniref:DUF3488 domain-containing protein n=1 Tax=Ahniella affigens TaxID=2021234 RepID=A0A2P1PT99_9GAMM|nr:DUF3488 and transglutaminase-like domain-containing protein [Ahniella affigens]AVP98077.1 DUF3488 domain-containing protein [Ahniella affigens]
MNETIHRRDILYLTWTMLLVVLAHVHWLPFVLTGTFLGLLALKLAWTQWTDRPVPLSVRLGMMLLVLALLVWSVGSPVGREGGSALLICLQAMKLLETRNRRDARILIGVAFFTSMIAFLFSQQILPTIYALMVIAVLFGCLYALTPNYLTQHESLADALKRTLPNAGKLALAAIPLAGVCFLFFPRLSAPLWGTPWDARGGKTGISDRMRPGMISALWNDDTPVFRARFDGPVPPAPMRYWRGPVFWMFDGTTWAGASRFAYERGVKLSFNDQQTIRYELQMEPTEQTWMFPLDIPFDSDATDLRWFSDGQVVSRRPVIEPRRVQFTSALQYEFESELSASHRQSALGLPWRGNPKSKALAASWRDKHGQDGMAIANEALAFINASFEYTLEPPPLRGDSIDDFLFNTQKGFCEHFSSSFVFLMRAAGVPARVVTGYLGGVYNETGGYLLVRNSDAHAWAEIWLAGRGWVRIDPTGAVAPDRINRGSVGAAFPESQSWFKRGWLGNLAMQSDWIAARWRDLVIEFNADRQSRLLEPFGLEKIGRREMALGLIALGTLALALGAWWSMRQYRRRAERDRLALAYQRFQARLGKRGLTIESSEGPTQTLARAAAKWPERSEELSALIHSYIACQYGHQQDADVRRRLIRQLKAF